MRPTTLLPFASAFILTACGQSDPGYTSDADAMANDRYNALAERVSGITGQEMPAGDQSAYMAGEGSAEGGAFAQGMQTPSAAQGGTRTQVLNSTQFNLPMAQLDLPAHWQVKQDPRTGAWDAKAQGLKVESMGHNWFIYASGQLGQMYQASGVQMRQPISIEQVLRQELEPRMRKEGYELVGSADAPAIAQADQRFLEGLYSVEPTRKSSRALVSDWRNGNKPFLVVIHYSLSQGSDMVYWSFQLTGMEADAANYEREKAGLLHGLASTRYNPAYFAAYARSEQQKAQQSWSAHNSRMQSNQAAFDAQQRAFRESSDATNAAIMGAYNNRMESQDRGQEAWTDMMYEQQNAVNPYSGEPIKVESGSNKYWMNQYGEYYGTNDVLTDPNAGNTTNFQWREVEVKP